MVIRSGVALLLELMTGLCKFKAMHCEEVMDLA